MVGMTPLGTLYYNGVTFDATAKIKTRVEFVRDPSSRATLFHRHTIDTTATVASGVSSTDDDVAAIRARLSKQGMHLIFVNKGFGNDLNVNNPNGAGLRDVEWGPKPEELVWAPIAGNSSGEITWRLTVSVPVCNTVGNHRTNGLMSFNYEVDFDVDEDGWQTRTITGELRIAQTRPPGENGAGLVPILDSADNYRWMVKAPAPAGFRRTYKWKISKDKSTLAFTVTDTQVQSRQVYPANVLSIKANHRTNWRRTARSGKKLFCTIGAQIKMKPSAPVGDSYKVFGLLCKKRLSYAQREGGVVFIEDVDIDEDLYGETHDFSMRYTMHRGLSEIVTGTGLFTPVDGAGNWAIWQASINDVHNPRGRAGLGTNAADDVLIDMCTSSIPQAVAPIATNTTTPSRTDNRSPGNQLIRNEKPPADRSWLDYEMAVEYGRKKPATRQSPQQLPSRPQSPGIPPGYQHPDGPGYGPNFNGPLRFNENQKGEHDDTISVSGAASNTLRLVGHARRAGYEIPQPSIRSVGDLTVEAGQVVEVDVKFKQKQEGIYFGVPVFTAVWSIVYLLTNTPNMVENRPNLSQMTSANW